MGTPGRAVTLSKLNDTVGWEKRRAKGEAAVKRMVMDMMELYVHRLRQRRPVYPKLTAEMEEFSRGFPYTPTPDQVCPMRVQPQTRYASWVPGGLLGMRCGQGCKLRVWCKDVSVRCGGRAYTVKTMEHNSEAQSLRFPGRCERRRQCTVGCRVCVSSCKRLRT